MVTQCIFLRFILMLILVSTHSSKALGFTLNLKSCNNRTRMNSRSWEQKVIWWKKEPFLPPFRAWDWPWWVLNWIVCFGPPQLLMDTFILPLKWLLWQLLSLWNASCSQIIHLFFLLNQNWFTAWIWELTSFFRLDCAIFCLCLVNLSELSFCTVK